MSTESCSLLSFPSSFFREQAEAVARSANLPLSRFYHPLISRADKVSEAPSSDKLFPLLRDRLLPPYLSRSEFIAISSVNRQYRFVSMNMPIFRTLFIFLLARSSLKRIYHQTQDIEAIYAALRTLRRTVTGTGCVVIRGMLPDETKEQSGRWREAMTSTFVTTTQIDLKGLKPACEAASQIKDPRERAQMLIEIGKIDPQALNQAREAASQIKDPRKRAQMLIEIGKIDPQALNQAREAASQIEDTEWRAEIFMEIAQLDPQMVPTACTEIERVEEAETRAGMLLAIGKINPREDVLQKACEAIQQMTDLKQSALLFVDVTFLNPTPEAQRQFEAHINKVLSLMKCDADVVDLQCQIYSRFASLQSKKGDVQRAYVAALHIDTPRRRDQVLSDIATANEKDGQTTVSLLMQITDLKLRAHACTRVLEKMREKFLSAKG